MLLRLPKWPPLPIGHLLSLANCFTHDFLGDFRQTSLWPSQEHSRKIGLSINELLDEPVKLHFRELPRKHVNVMVERETYDHRLRIAKHLR